MASLRRLFIAVSTLLALLGKPILAEELSYDPPPLFQEKMAMLMRPLEEVLQTAPAPEEAEAGGTVLLDETIQYLDDAGHRLILDRRVLKALNDGGAKAAAEGIFSYRKANQKIHLISAQTILPDGHRLPVQPGATILQTPQRQADEGVYDDGGELKVIFPNVKPGAVVEAVVVIEESQFRIPGEFTSFQAWAGGWPVRQKRQIIELSGPLAERLKQMPLGPQIPVPTREAQPGGRIRFTWDGRGLAAIPVEPGQPPISQVGPALWLTTLTDWDELARWYAPLVESRSMLEPGLRTQVGAWTATAKSPSEVLAILHERVARDVRYTGLEFGESDLRPHDCNAVWNNQYGDCKDKANLLRAMLQHKGIPAWLVLLNTENLGRIEKRSPDYRQFNHAIVAVQLSPGEYLFCDPTVPFSKPGLLSPSDADRDVLLIKESVGEWAHTPPQDAGQLRYDLDLRLGADGELSGWMTRVATGYYGTSDADFYRTLDKDQLRENAHLLVRGFYPNAEVVDVSKTDVEKWDGTFRVKIFFRLPPGHAEASPPNDGGDQPDGAHFLPLLSLAS